MSENEHSEIVERLFHQALARDAASRADFLATACGGDVAVMADVASLLTAYENDQPLLERPAFHLTASEMAARVLDAEREIQARLSPQLATLLDNMGGAS